MNALVGLILTTARLRLRPVIESDAPGLFAIFSDPLVTRYWSTPPWTAPAEAGQLVAQDRAAAAAGTAVRLAVLPLGAGDPGPQPPDPAPGTDPHLIGVVSLFHLDHGNRRAEIGYALHRSAWRRGYAREAVGAVIGHAFDTLRLNRLEADADPRNEASTRLLERLGFQREGLLRQRWIVAGEVSDSAWYGLLRQDWRPPA